jgi:hypothetical protein
VPLCHWLIEAKHAGFLHDTTSSDRQPHYLGTLLLFANMNRKGLWKPCVATERLSVEAHAIWRIPWWSPAQATPHVLHAWNAHIQTDVHVHVAVRSLRLMGMLDEHTQNSTSQYSTCIVAHCPAVRDALLLHSPASPHPASTSLSIPSTSALHICTSVGKVTSAAFLFVDVFCLIALLFIFLAPTLLSSYSHPAHSSQLLFHFKRADV